MEPKFLRIFSRKYFETLSESQKDMLAKRIVDKALPAAVIIANAYFRYIGAIDANTSWIVSVIVFCRFWKN